MKESLRVRRFHACRVFADAESGIATEQLVASRSDQRDFDACIADRLRDA